MTRKVWAAVAVLVVGLFMLVAGIGPYIWIPLLVILAGVVLIVLARRDSAKA